MDLAGLYRDIVERASDGIWVFDLAGRTIYANPAMAALLGATSAEVSGLGVAGFLDDAGREQFADHLAELGRGTVNAGEVEGRFVRRDGTCLWGLISETTLHAEDGTLTGFLIQVNDYSERRATLDALRTSESRLAEAQQIARVGSWTWDLLTDQLVGSPALTELHDQDAPAFSLPAKRFLETVHEDDRTTVLNAAGSVSTGSAEEFVFVARIRGAQGWLWMRARGVGVRDADGALVAISGSHQDITETKNAELALIHNVTQNALLNAVTSAANEAHTLTEALQEARALILDYAAWVRARVFVPVADASKDRAERELVPLYIDEADRGVDVSTPVQSLLELSLATRACRERQPAWDEAGRTVAFSIVSEGRDAAVLTLTSATPVKRKILVESLTRRVATQLGQVAQRERAARQLAAARDAAMEASRQKSEFLATMSHEVRTPLNGVIGLNELLLGTDLSAEQHRLASGVQAASRALLGVINDVLDFSKIEAGRLVLEQLDFEIRPVLEQISEIFVETARAKGLPLLLSIEDDVPRTASGDPSRLTQVLTNLVSNAVKFTAHGQVSMNVSASPLSDGATTLMVKVTDTGVGIAADDVQRLFAPFTQADASTTRVYGGTGLGLAISKQVVEALGGVLRYTPNRRGGSIFSFTAMLGPASGPDPEAADQPDADLLRGRRVLVVHHSHEVETAEKLSGRAHLDPTAELVERVSKWGVRSTRVDSSDGALTELVLAAAENDPYEVVLLDLVLPLRRGLDLARRMRAAYADVTLVLLAPHGSLDHEVLREVGVSDWLARPVSAPMLRSTLVRSLSRRDTTASSTTASVTEDTGAAHRVLVVEDNEVNQMVATGMLRSLGYQVEVAADGVLALDAVAEREFDAILMDVQMPRMDGYDATRAIRNGDSPSRRAPIIAMTAAAVAGERERCLDSGMDDFMTKPVDPTALADVLAEWTGARPGQLAATSSPIPGQGVSLDAEGLDVARLTMLRDLDEDSTEYLDRAISNFVRNSTVAMAAMRLAVDSGDAASLRQVSHKLVGGALNLGVTRAGTAVRRLEHLADTGTVVGAVDLLPEVEEALARGRAALLAYQASYDSVRAQDVS